MVGNWKMNGSQALCRALVPPMIAAAAVRVNDARVKMVVCPPTLYQASVAEMARGSGLAVGVQNVSAFGNGAYTGEISAAMLRELEYGYAIVGHSERRTLLRESDADVAAKARACVAEGIVPIVCVGETEREREEARSEMVVGRQLGALIGWLPPAELVQCVIAYEPVWAIGTGKTATPTQVQEMHAFIRQYLRAALGAQAEQVSILYGGSVKPGNAAQLFALPDVDGGLIGGASLVAEDFLSIYRAAQEVEHA